MADDAGFAAALTIRERLLNNALLLAYTSGGFPRSLSVPLPGGPPDASIDVFLAPPTVICEADNSLALTLEMWGSLSVTVGGVIYARSIHGRLGIRIRPKFTIDGTDLVLSPESNDLTVPAWEFSVLSGGSFPADVDLYLTSGLFRDRLQSAVQTAISVGLVKLPRIDISFLGSIVTVANMTAAARVRQGAVMIGLDIETDTVTIKGDIDLLTDFARNNDIAAVTSAAAVPILMQDVEAKVRDEVAKNGATLEQWTPPTVDMGRFRFAGKISKSTGTATFSFSVVPAMFHTRPGLYVPDQNLPAHGGFVVRSRTWPALEFSTADVAVDVQKAVWLDIVEVIGAALTGIIVPAIIEDMVRDVVGQFKDTIETASIGTTVRRVRRLKPTKPGGITVRIEIAEYEITAAGTYIGITLQPEVPPAALIGLTSIPDQYRTSTLRYTVRLPPEAGSDDPALRVRWTIIDLTSGTVLVNDDDVALNRETYDFVPASVGPGLSRLGIGCRVYRALGPDITDFLNDGITLEIRGPLQPRAYARWSYGVPTAQVQLDEPSDTYRYTGTLMVDRWSNLHRTDRPCKMALRRSRYASLVLFDTLPFSVTYITERRAQLCDYCFYGGPAGIRPSL